jgi:hypothetical protein
MSTSQSYRPQTRKPRPKKVFTDYPMPLAFERIEFYLRVLEAHFERLGTPRRTKEEEARGLSRAAQEGG